MSTKRTKKEKIKAAERRIVYQPQTGGFSYSDGSGKTSASIQVSRTQSATETNTAASIEKLFGYPLAAIYSDLKRTFFVATFVASLLAAITYYVRFQN